MQFFSVYIKPIEKNTLSITCYLVSTSSNRGNTDSKTSNAERTARYVHVEKLEQNTDGQMDTKMLCRWFLIDRSTASVRCKVISTMGRTNNISCFLHTLKDSFPTSLCLFGPMYSAWKSNGNFTDVQQDACKFTLTNMYLCFKLSMMDEEKW